MLREYQLDLALRLGGRETAKLKAVPAEFKKLLKKTVRVLRKNPLLKAKMQGGVIHAVITGDDEIAMLNGAYRGKAEPTDVLALSYFDELNFPGENNLVGEIMISVETAQRQAKKHGHSLSKELRFLFAHGLLHLFGFDHQTAREKKAMFALQDEVLS